VVDAAGRADVVRDRIALVTGGAQGIGEEIVRSLALATAVKTSNLTHQFDLQKAIPL
jgi:NAD(P)-dependent dehydrogenase (short-subunit alcohol dehydrogenase family)